MRKNQPRMEERIERRISAITSISMCALTVIAQIATTLILTHFLREKASYAYTALELLGAVVAIRVYQRSGSPSYKLVWMCLLLGAAGLWYDSLLAVGWYASGQKSQPASGASGPSARELADVQRGESLPPAAAVRHLGSACSLSAEKRLFTLSKHASQVFWRWQALF